MFEVPRTTGAMHQVDAGPPVVDCVRFGFSHEGLYVRLDGPEPMADLLRSGHELSLTFLRPEGLRITAKSTGSDNGCYVNHAAVRAAVATALELVVPLTVLGAAPGQLLSFAVIVNRRGPHGVAAIERHPDRHPIDVQVPGPDFDATHWRA